MASGRSVLSDMQRSVSDALGANWRLFLSQGLVMIILGLFAVAEPAVATFAVDIYFGWLLLISGIVGLVATFSAKHIPAFLWGLITAALSAAAGVLLIWKPWEGVLTLTLLLTVFFIIEGVFQIATSVAYRDIVGNSWRWMLASGVADLALAAILMLGWPTTAVWTLGFLVGINLITSGGAILMIAVAGRDVAKTMLTPEAPVRH